mgnify:CR=1 FL=1
MSHDEINNLHKAIRELKESNDKQFADLNAKVEPIYQAYTTISNGSVWIKYAFWLVGSVVAAGLAIREFFKN